MSKVESAKLKVSKFNPTIQVNAVPSRLTPDTALALLAGHDMIIDATDNYQARYVLSDACVILQIPLMSGSAIGFEGQLTLLCTPQGPW